MAVHVLSTLISNPDNPISKGLIQHKASESLGVRREFFETTRRHLALSSGRADAVADMSVRLGSIYGGFPCKDGEARFFPRRNDRDGAVDDSGIFESSFFSDSDDTDEEEEKTNSQEAYDELKKMIKRHPPTEPGIGDDKQLKHSVGVSMPIKGVLDFLFQDNKQVSCISNQVKKRHQNQLGIPVPESPTVWLAAGVDHATMGGSNIQKERGETAFCVALEGAGGSTRDWRCSHTFALTNQKDGNASMLRYGRPFVDELPLEMELGAGGSEEEPMRVVFDIIVFSLDYPAAVAATGHTSFKQSNRDSPTSSMDKRLGSQVSDGFVPFVSITNLSAEYSKSLEGNGHLSSGKEYLNSGLFAPCLEVPFTKIWHEGMHCNGRPFAAAVCRWIDAMDIAAGGGFSGASEFMKVWKKHSTYNPCFRKNKNTGQTEIGQHTQTFAFIISENWTAFFEALSSVVQKADPSGQKGYLSDLEIYMKFLRGATIAMVLYDEDSAFDASKVLAFYSYMLLCQHTYLFGRPPPTMRILPGEGTTRIGDIVRQGISPRALTAESTEHSHQLRKSLERQHGGRRGGYKSPATGDTDVAEEKLVGVHFEGAYMTRIARGVNGTPQQRVKRAQKKANKQKLACPDLEGLLPVPLTNGTDLGPGDPGFGLFGVAETADARAILDSFISSSSASSNSEPLRLSLVSFKVGDEELVASETDGIWIHFYQSNGRPSFEVTNGRKHDEGLRVRYCSIYKYSISSCGNAVHFQLGDAPALLKKNSPNMGLSLSASQKHLNLKAEARSPQSENGQSLGKATESSLSLWASKKPSWMIAKSPSVYSRRALSVFRPDMTNFEEAREAYRSSMTEDSQFYRNGPLLSQSKSEREKIRSDYVKATEAWLERRGSPVLHCPFCLERLFIKHPEDDKSREIAGLFTLSKPHRPHRTCDVNFIHGTGPGARTNEANGAPSESNQSADELTGDEYESSDESE